MVPAFAHYGSMYVCIYLFICCSHMAPRCGFSIGNFAVMRGSMMWYLPKVVKAVLGDLERYPRPVHSWVRKPLRCSPPAALSISWKYFLSNGNIVALVMAKPRNVDILKRGWRDWKTRSRIYLFCAVYAYIEHLHMRRLPYSFKETRPEVIVAWFVENWDTRKWLSR